MPDPSDFLAAAQAAQTRPGRPCRVGEILRELDDANPKLATSVRAALAQPVLSLQHTAISKAFATYGYAGVSDGMVGHHRSGACQTCYERERAAA